MRSLGGACVGLAACLLGCASAWKPPPEPGPPPAQPPGGPSTFNPFRRLEWKASARTIGCGLYVDLKVPADLATHVRQDGPNEILIVPPGSPPGDALFARWDDPSDEEKDEETPQAGGFFELVLRAFDWIERALTAEHMLPEIFARLHELASGVAIAGDAPVPVTTTMKDNFFEVTYADPKTADRWQILGISIEHCVVMVLDRARPDGVHHFTDVVKQLRNAALSYTVAEEHRHAEFERSWILRLPPKN